MSTRRTVWLAAAFVVLLVYFALFEGFSVKLRTPAENRGEAIVACGPEDPKALTVKSPRGTVSGEQQYGRWSGEAGDALGDLAEALCHLPVIDRITDPGDLASFGLLHPETEVRIVTAAGTRDLLIGDASPANNLLYAKFADSPEVLKIGAQMRSEADKAFLRRPSPDGDAP